MPTRSLREGVLVFVVLVGMTGAVQADVLMPGQKKVRREVVIDFGPYAERSTWALGVEAGDTLSALAERHLGSAARYKEIITLNAGLTAERLIAGSTILMPPRAANSAEWWDLLALTWDGRLERVFHNAQFPYHHYGSGLWAVPHARYTELHERLASGSGENRDRRTLTEELSKEPWVARAPERQLGTVVFPDASPVHSLTETYVIVKIEAGRIELRKTAVQHWDKARRPLAGLGLIFDPGSGLLVGLAMCGVIGLVIVALRRRRMRVLSDPVALS